MYEWEEQRKKKLKTKEEEKTKKIQEDYDYIPKINEKSSQIAEKNELKIKEPNVFLRLAGHDQILKEKKKILIKLYTPSFQPKSYVPRNMNLNKFKKNNYMSARERPYDDEEEEEEEEEDNRKLRKKRRKRRNEDSDDEEEDEDEEGEEEEDDEEEEEEEEQQEEEDDFDYQQDTMKFAEDDVQDALRNTLFHRKKKK